eukprot:5190839-Pleurochrysis_carterae.AAC.1
MQVDVKQQVLRAESCGSRGRVRQEKPITMEASGTSARRISDAGLDLENQAGAQAGCAPG